MFTPVCYRGGPTVFALTGQDKTGAVALLQQGLVAEVVTEVPLSGVHGLWSIHHRREGAMEEDAEGEDEPRALVFFPVLAWCACA